MNKSKRRRACTVYIKISLKSKQNYCIKDKDEYARDISKYMNCIHYTLTNGSCGRCTSESSITEVVGAYNRRKRNNLVNRQQLFQPLDRFHQL